MSSRNVNVAGTVTPAVNAIGAVDAFSAADFHLGYVPISGGSFNANVSLQFIAGQATGWRWSRWEPR